MPDPDSALAFVLDVAKAKQLCVRWSCTTCGAMEFRKATLERNGNCKVLGSGEAHDLLRELRVIEPARFYDGVEFLLRWASQVISQSEIKCALGETEAGAFYSQMLRAKDAADASRAENARQYDPAFVAENRARKAAERAARHEERLAIKRVKDAERRATMNDGETKPN